MTTQSKKNISIWKIISPTHVFSALSAFIEIVASGSPTYLFFIRNFFYGGWC